MTTIGLYLITGTALVVSFIKNKDKTILTEEGKSFENILPHL